MLFHKLQQAGPIIYPLLFCSLLALALAFERVWVFLAYSMKETARDITWGLPSGLWLLAQLGKKDESNGESDVEQGSRGEISGTRTELEEHLALWLEKQRIYLQRRCRLLQLIGALAPLLGLLGTVLGIITMFQEVAQHQGPVTPALLASGMWQAMSTTAIGLVVAIPTLGLGQGLLLWSQARLEAMTDVLNRSLLSNDFKSQ